MPDTKFPSVRPFWVLRKEKSALRETGHFLVRLKVWGWGPFPLFQDRFQRPFSWNEFHHSILIKTWFLYKIDIWNGWSNYDSYECRIAIRFKLIADRFIWELTSRSQLLLLTLLRAHQRSGEGVVRGNGRPTGCFWRVRFFSAPVRFALKTPESLKWEEKKRTLQNTLLDDRLPHDTFSAPLEHPNLRFEIKFGVTNTDIVILSGLHIWTRVKLSYRLDSFRTTYCYRYTNPDRL